ncbi:hypothetical protein LR48_Vigan10g067200 [Vigna angularis]|uniref:Uncharacterized protein n=1 Tax=Phaseolus angularis TaxID=3914 RepID=A0A0L9VI86_PHAAN|nr:hypothetical protein LR48_Vigan10g067200 [Vigna angularis]
MVSSQRNLQLSGELVSRFEVRMVLKSGFWVFAVFQVFVQTPGDSWLLWRQGNLLWWLMMVRRGG